MSPAEGSKAEAATPKGHKPDQTFSMVEVLGQDGLMAGLLARHPLLRPEPRPLFVALANSVVSQQLSAKAAQTIWNRLEAKFPIEPAALAQAPLEALRAVGLSNSKAGYIQGLAEFALSGGLEGIEHLDDDALVAYLTQLKGIGSWTVQMVLMFSLGRPDVWPTGDLGIQKAAQRVYAVSSQQQLIELGERFRPYRSHAAWFLWRSLENL